MDDNLSILILIMVGVLMVEISGFVLIKSSPRFTNSSAIMKSGKTLCILGLVAFVLGLLAYWSMVTR